MLTTRFLVQALIVALAAMLSLDALFYLCLRTVGLIA